MDSSNTVGYAKDCRNKSGLHSNVLRYCIHDNMIITAFCLRSPWCCRSQSKLFSASVVKVRYAHEYMRAIQPCSTDWYCVVVTSWHYVLHRKLAIKHEKQGPDDGALRHPKLDVLLR